MTNADQHKARVRRLAAEMYKVRTGSEDAPQNKISQMDYHLALKALTHLDAEIEWEYGATFSVDGKDSTEFPSWWTTNLTEAVEDLQWHAGKAGFPDREWRIVKRYPAGKQQELNSTEQREVDSAGDQ